MINTLKNRIVEGAHGRSFLLDITFREDGTAKPVLIFGHGFKGFKDWGHWSALADAFAELGIVFVKFNYAFNGTSLDDPLNFTDLEGFAQNNFSKELDDFQSAINWVFDQKTTSLGKELNLNKVNVAGHSRGGPIALITAKEDTRIQKAITWAAVQRLDYAWTDEKFLETWKSEGVYYVKNGRTGQMMPHDIQFYENFQAHKSRFDLHVSMKDFQKPTLIIHGKADPAVPFFAAQGLKELIPHAKLEFIDSADHVFNAKHPFEETELPDESKKLLKLTSAFIFSD